MSNEDMASRIQVYRKKIEKIRVKQIKLSPLSRTF